MSETADYPAFDPGDPFDAMAQEFKNRVTDMRLEAEKAAVFRDLDPYRQLECFLSGVLTGAVGVAFASINREGRDTMMEYIASCLPTARLLAESMVDDPKMFPVKHSQ